MTDLEEFASDDEAIDKLAEAVNLPPEVADEVKARARKAQRILVVGGSQHLTALAALALASSGSRFEVVNIDEAQELIEETKPSSPKMMAITAPLRYVDEFPHYITPKKIAPYGKKARRHMTKEEKRRK